MWQLLAIAALILAIPCKAQWLIQDSHTMAELRGIHSIGNGIAWASGANGTVVRTTDEGHHWQLCAVPPGADTLDLPGIQAFDANTAIVMSRGKGDLSRLYETTDACRSWRVVLTNPIKDGFFDAISFSQPFSQPHPAGAYGVLIGNPIGGAFPISLTADRGEHWHQWGREGLGWKGECGERQAKALKDEAIFPTSNGSVFYFPPNNFMFVTGGQSGARVVYTDFHDFDGPPCWTTFSSVGLPLARASSSAGAFAVAAKGAGYFPLQLVVVGGDFTKPDETSGNAAVVSSKGGIHLPLSSYFTATNPSTPPHGYRSAVAYDAPTATWISVGPNGTDISTDDGRNWQSVKPALADVSDADKNWNSVSLPFVVGTKGRIGKLRSDVLKP